LTGIRTDGITAVVIDPIEVIVLAAPGRDEAHRRCYASIEASDIGKDYAAYENPRDVPPRTHWECVLTHAANAETEFVLVLEDDCLVNRHILHNCRTWPATRDKHFGCGFLYKPGGYPQKVEGWYTQGTDWYGTVAVLYRTELLADFIDSAMKWMESHDSNAWDCAITRAVLTGGYGIRVHEPCIAEHLHDVPSAAGNVGNPEHDYYYRSSRGTFDAEWRRPG